MLHKLKSVCSIRKKTIMNKCVKCFAKVSGPTVTSLNSTGNSFQLLGPATANALKPQSVLLLGTTGSSQTADLKTDHPETAEPWVQKATRLDGARPLRHFIFDMLRRRKPMQIKQDNDMWSKRYKPRIRRFLQPYLYLWLPDRIFLWNWICFRGQEIQWW